MGSLEETKIWLLFTKDWNYIPGEIYNNYSGNFDEIGAKLYKLYENWKTL
jgi:hypothetical protein